MGKGVAHYFRDGTRHTGGMHKMPNGELHSGARHTDSSKKLFHFGELSKTAQKKAKEMSNKAGMQKNKQDKPKKMAGNRRYLRRNSRYA